MKSNARYDYYYYAVAPPVGYRNAMKVVVVNYVSRESAYYKQWKEGKKKVRLSSLKENLYIGLTYSSVCIYISVLFVINAAW